MPDAAARGALDDVETDVARAVSQIGDAMNLVVEFFTAATYGFVAEIGAQRMTATENDPNDSSAQEAT